MDRPLLSVCVPAYNRPEDLGLLLQTFEEQELIGNEILIVDDHSPRGAEIESVITRFAAKNQDLTIRYERNLRNLGYDGNFRKLVELASGRYCLFMGDDDLLAEGAIAKIARVLRDGGDLGVVLRSWITVDRDTGAVLMRHRYFTEDRRFAAGPRSAVTLFRRAVFLSGLVLQRDAAHRYATDRFDGTLLYQLHLVGNIMLDKAGYVVSDYLAMRRVGEKPTHFFGSADAEKTRFAPGVIGREHSVTFMKGMLDIARHLEHSRGVPVYEAILTDIGNYSYPVLAIQAERRTTLARYAIDLARLGLFRNPFFALYALSLLVVGRRLTERAMTIIKTRLGHTPRLGGFYEGEAAADRT